MSIVNVGVIPGADAGFYEAVSGKAMPGGELPGGCQVHIAGPVEQGWRVITVWESQDALDRFREESLTPAIREVVGDEGPPPQLDINPVHTLITA